MKGLPLLCLALAGCDAWISSAELADRADRDRDGHFPPSHGGDDCNDEDGTIHPGAIDAWYDGIDSDCAGNNDYDQDGDGLTSADFLELGGTDCDDTDPGVGNALELWNADCDGDGLPGTAQLPSCQRPSEDTTACGDLAFGWYQQVVTAPDCDDNNAAVFEGAPEIYYNGIDENCDGLSDFDQDGDGAVIPGTPPGMTLPGQIPGDCDDEDPTVLPGAADEPYDGVDQDCDGSNDYDADRDGFVARSWEDFAGGSAPATGDCNDGSDLVFPGAPEVPYDGIDQNCDGASDFDADGDGFEVDVDCDDTRANISPGLVEIPYDGIDNDCDPLTTDADADGDGQEGLLSPTGTDCNDSDPAIFQGAPDVWYDGVDSNCDGANDFDQDGDGFPTQGVDLAQRDCNDLDTRVYPGSPSEIPYDGIDTDCDGANDYDQDGDGVPFIQVTGQGPIDCNDQNPNISPSLIETWYDGVDQNCDGADDFDQDGDGWARIGPNGGQDCNDLDANISPSADELPYDGVDQDCDPGNDNDADGDGLPAPLDPANPGPNDDCDDSNAQIGAGSAEVWYDGIDQDCRQDNDFDRDKDGYVAVGFDSEVGLGAPLSGDCDDLNPSIHPGRAEIWYNNIDENCDGNRFDRDDDGFIANLFVGVETSPSFAFGECDDGDPTISPIATEVWYDGVDQDCDGANDYDQDEDGYLTQGVAPAQIDCDDLNPAVNPGQPDNPATAVLEDCDVDADGDGVPARNDCDDTDPSVDEAVHTYLLQGGFVDERDLVMAAERICPGGTLRIVEDNALNTLEIPFFSTWEIRRSLNIEGVDAILSSYIIGEPMIRVLPGVEVAFRNDIVMSSRAAAAIGVASDSTCVVVEGRVTFENVTFRLCQSNSPGGAIRVEAGGSGAAQNVQFQTNSSVGGGAVYVGPDASFDIFASDIQSSVRYQNQQIGAQILSYGDLTLNNIDINPTSIPGIPSNVKAGHAVEILGGNATIENSTLTRSSNTGAALYIDQADVTLSNVILNEQLSNAQLPAPVPGNPFGLSNRWPLLYWDVGPDTFSTVDGLDVLGAAAAGALVSARGGAAFIDDLNIEGGHSHGLLLHSPGDADAGLFRVQDLFSNTNGRAFWAELEGADLQTEIANFTAVSGNPPAVETSGPGGALRMISGVVSGGIAHQTPLPYVSAAYDGVHMANGALWSLNSAGGRTTVCPERCTDLASPLTSPYVLSAGLATSLPRALGTDRVGHTP